MYNNNFLEIWNEKNAWLLWIGYHGIYDFNSAFAIIPMPMGEFTRNQLYPGNLLLTGILMCEYQIN